MIPSSIIIKNGKLPDAPGVYFYYDKDGVLLYVGKAASLLRRVGSYFVKAHDARIAELVRRITRIDYIETPTVIEALVLEANRIKAHQPPFNILERDDKSFLYLCITNEDFPKPLLLRGHELERMGIRPFLRVLSPAAKKKFLAVYGPYVNGRSLRTALQLVRKTMPWSTCSPPNAPVGVLPLRIPPVLILASLDCAPSGPCSRHPSGGAVEAQRPCFDAQIGKCPGVCVGAISKKEYRKIIRQLMLFFAGKKATLLRELTQAMERAAREGRFEDAAKLRDRVFALEHMRDTSLITRDEAVFPPIPSSRHPTIPPLSGRIEAYDIAHISGTANVGAMVVFENGQPKKSAYRKFRMKTFSGGDDVAAMEAVLRRRLLRHRADAEAWPLPELFVIDGGEGQVHATRRVLAEFGLHDVPIVGIAKGFDRKQDRLVFEEVDREFAQAIVAGKNILQRARDEAHRFAGVYHRVLRSRASLGMSPRRSRTKKSAPAKGRT